MGIGLAICSGILILHEFIYGVVSNIGNGSEFFFMVQNQYTNDGRNLI